MFIFTSLLTLVILGRAFPQYDVSEETREFRDSNSPSNVENQNQTSDYDITEWVAQLHLQQCAFVEIGEGFCAIFVEARDHAVSATADSKSEVREFFLGLCSCAIIRTWMLCPPELTKHRQSDCIFAEASPYTNSEARVHRRLCDVTLLQEHASPCGCNDSLAGERLHAVQGFPTCYMNPLPESLCHPRGVCGIAQCWTTTIQGIHSPRCDPVCHLMQPFCEDVDSPSSAPVEIRSSWSSWSRPRCNASCGEGALLAIAWCRDRVTGDAAIDCLGPGSLCCSESPGKCHCEVSVVDGAMTASRFTDACVSDVGCSPNDTKSFTHKTALAPWENIDTAQLCDLHMLASAGSMTPMKLGGAESMGSRRLLRANRLTRNTAVRDFYRSRRSDDEEDEDEAEEEDEAENEDDIDDAGLNDDDEANEADDGVSDEVEDAAEDEDAREETIDRGRFARVARSAGKRRRVQRSSSLEEREKRDADENGECEDGSTEAPQYYDYEASAVSPHRPCSFQVTLTVTVNVLITLAGRLPE